MASSRVLVGTLLVNLGHLVRRLPLWRTCYRTVPAYGARISAVVVLFFVGRISNCWVAAEYVEQRLGVFSDDHHSACHYGS